MALRSAHAPLVHGVMHPDTSTSLADLFSANRKSEWYFVRASGNWGDSLIHAGAESLARSFGLRWTEVDYRKGDADPPPGAHIYLQGGGGLNPWSSGSALNNLRRALSVPDAVVIQGPQTCVTDRRDLTRLLEPVLSNVACAEVHFFAREMTSAPVLAEMLPATFRLYLDHDTAFCLPLTELLATARLRQVPKARYPLIVAREDNEAPGATARSSGKSVSLDPAYFASDFSHWLRIHAFATTIATNRLHSAIAGSLLGKHVVLLPGSYHKNRSVWEFSLKERGVEWLDRLDAATAPRQARGWLPRRIANSWKVRRGLLWLRGVPMR